MSSYPWNTEPLSESFKVPPPHDVPDQVLYSLLGRGLNATEWQNELESLHYTWKPILRKEIITRELLYFKSEIERLLASPNTNIGLGPRTNSYNSVLLQIQGKTGERDERLQAGRLCGPEVLCRNLENHVKKWEKKSTKMSTSSLSQSNNTSAGGIETTGKLGIPNHRHISGSSVSSAAFSNAPIASMNHQLPYSSNISPLNTYPVSDTEDPESNQWVPYHAYHTPRAAQFNNYVQYDTSNIINPAASNNEQSCNYTCYQPQTTLPAQDKNNHTPAASGSYDYPCSDTCACEACFSSST